jgi:hypothetical protein
MMGLNPEPEYLTFKEPKNRFQGTNFARPCSLAGRYDHLIPTRFLAPIDCLKIPAQVCCGSQIDSRNCYLVTMHYKLHHEYGTSHPPRSIYIVQNSTRIRVQYIFVINTLLYIHPKVSLLPMILLSFCFFLKFTFFP